jgi:hypothetical protein
MRRARLISLLIVLAEPSALRAQWQLTADLGRSVIEQPELPTSGATTAGAAFDFAREHSLIHTSALGAQTSDGRYTGQWIALASFLTPSWKSWGLQATGSFTAFGQTSLSATTSRDLLVQARTGSLGRGLAIGGGLGTTIHNATAIPNRRAVADGWWSIANERFSLDATLTRTRSVFGGSSILVDISRREANYLDLSAGWSHDVGAWSVAASAGMRGRNGTFDRDDNWQALSATAWLGSRVGLTLEAGRSLEDLVRGVPRTRYASIGLRLSSRPHLALFRRKRPIVGPQIVVARDAEVCRIEISNVSAARVELMGDFTDWEPMTLDRDGSTWRLRRVIAPGPHRVAIRIDGGDWIVPGNLPRVEDELGGSVGLITVP